MKQIIGFGTGALYKNLEGQNTVSREAIGLVRLSGCNAIEIYAGFASRLAGLEKLSKEHFYAFDYVSLHAPDDMNYDNSAHTKDVLEKISEAHKRIGFAAIVIHGLNIVDPVLLERFDLPYIIENVDYLKRGGKTLEDMRAIFSRFDRPMNLDVLHAYTLTQNNTVALAMAKEFKKRIKQVHLSGLRIQDIDRQHHFPIYETQQLDILESVPKSVPVIIESVFPKLASKHKLIEGLKKEYEYVREHLG